MAENEALRKRLDPKGVIGESYRIEGISEPECRSIFLDWAISLPADRDARDILAEVLAEFGAGWPDHPMTKVLTEGLMAPERTGRRGGRRARAPE